MVVGVEDHANFSDGHGAVRQYVFFAELTLLVGGRPSRSTLYRHLEWIIAVGLVGNGYDGASLRCVALRTDDCNIDSHHHRGVVVASRSLLSSVADTTDAVRGSAGSLSNNHF